MGWKRGVKEWLHDLGSMFYPDLCHVCGQTLVRGEEVMCLDCRLDLPRTNLHREKFSILHQRVAGHVPIERAASYFYYYRDNPYAKLIHKAKYNGLWSIARKLGAEYASEIKADGFFDGIDLLLPVPLHEGKERKRGYNQSREIAIGISQATGIPVGDNLIAKRGHSTQTRLGAFERWLNARDIYDVVYGSELVGRHLLVIDDVLTTGATLLSCCEAIHAVAPTATVSVLTLAVARQQ